MTIQELIAGAQTEGWTDEDGEPLQPVFLPGLDEPAIVELENRVGAKLPKDYREVLSHCSGIEDLYEGIDLTGDQDGWDVEEFCPRRIGLAPDGQGNFWCVDLLPTQEEQSAIFFISHDPPEVTLTYVGIMPFIEDVVDGCRGFPTGPVDHKTQSGLPNGGEYTKEEAVSQDQVLAEFASLFPDGTKFLDLRGRCKGTIELMAVEDVQRHTSERIFAYRDKPKRRGILGRLFGH